jgi:hypothetical protein
MVNQQAREIALLEKIFITNVNELNAMLELAGPEDSQLVTLIQQVVTLLTPAPPPAPVATTMVATLTVDNPKGTSMTAAGLRKSAKAAVALTINDDGTATLAATFFDQYGAPITGLTAPPPGVTLVFASSDQTPGPSAFVITPDPSGLFAKVAPVQPPADPNNLAQNVDFTVTATGLAGATGPVSSDGGTLSIVADASKPGGVAAVLSEP